MTTLTDFLRAQIAKDEARLSEYLSPHIRVRSIGEGMVALTDERTGDEQVMSEASLLDGHLFDAAGRRARRECEAKRRILELVGAGPDLHPPRGCQDCDILRALAVSYADHPDYREEWAP